MIFNRSSSPEFSAEIFSRSFDLRNITEINRQLPSNEGKFENLRKCTFSLS